MNALRQALVDYLAVRRVLGYRLARAEKLLAQFLTYLEDRGENHLTTETALAWATLPAGAHRNWMATRLSVVRRFAAHLRGIDPATEVPPANLLPGRTCRATPYLYSEEDIAALMTAASALRTSHRKATYRTLIALLAVTGMRIGEAIGLDRIDFDAINGLLTIRKGKFGKSRKLPLHPSTVSALSDYLRRTDQPSRRRSTSALFVSTAGTRLLYTNVQNTFDQLVCCAGLTPRSPSCRPRLHDIRHGFAIRTLLDAYRDGGDPDGAAAAGRCAAGASPQRWRMTALATTLQAFFTDRLIRQRQASPHTLSAYRDTLRLMLVFASERCGTEPSKLDIDDLDAPLVGAFLDHLEHRRENGVRTRNARLAAIRSLFRYAALRIPDREGAQPRRA